MSKMVKAEVGRDASTLEATRLPASAPASAATANTPSSGQARCTWLPRRAAAPRRRRSMAAAATSMSPANS